LIGEATTEPPILSTMRKGILSGCFYNTKLSS
jgi:hypothetical protein